MKFTLLSVDDDRFFGVTWLCGFGWWCDVIAIATWIVWISFWMCASTADLKGTWLVQLFDDIDRISWSRIVHFHVEKMTVAHKWVLVWCRYYLVMYTCCFRVFCYQSQQTEIAFIPFWKSSAFRSLHAFS